MKAPERMLDDPQLSGELRSELTQLAETRVDYDLPHGLSRLQRTLGLLPGTGADAASDALPELASSASAGAGLSVAIKAALILAVGGAATWAVGYLGTPAGPATNASSVPAALSAPAPAAEPAPPEHVPTRRALESPAEDAHEQLVPSARDRADDPPARRQHSASRREIALMVRIKSLLERDPAAAHRLIVTSAREFPAGVLAEEREGLDAIALFKLGAPGARSHAERFLRRYPQSSLRPRVERLLDGEAP
jgi:hypothetical protein